MSGTYFAPFNTGRRTFINGERTFGQVKRRFYCVGSSPNYNGESANNNNNLFHITQLSKRIC